jgi:glycosyltransferase involved in cell wall biosynthesis
MGTYLNINNMHIRLFFERIYCALLKRGHIKKQKTYEEWAAKGYLSTPEVSFIIQSHNKSTAVMWIVKQLRTYPNAEIIVIDDGSKGFHTNRLTRFLREGNEFLIKANDLYEIVMYDKSIRFANGDYIVLLQDDDKISDMGWLERGLAYFNKYPEMVILGGFNGLKFWIDEDNKLGCTDVCTESNSSAEFQFVHTVNRAPMLLKKSLYMQHLNQLDLSFAPFQSDDTELCLRAWMSGLKVGWYNAGFKSLMAGGMRIWNTELLYVQGHRNHTKLYEMYHKYADKITEKVQTANFMLQ